MWLWSLLKAFSQLTQTVISLILIYIIFISYKIVFIHQQIIKMDG